MLKTRHNQTPFELAEEFIDKVRDSKTVSPVLVKLCDDWAKLETGEVPMESDVAERIKHQIAHAGSNPNSILDTRQIAFYKNCKPNISDIFLAWIAVNILTRYWAVIQPTSISLILVQLSLH